MFNKINGSAGYGKTHLLVDNVAELHESETEFLLITPTHKSALVLNKKLEARGLPKFARTLHSVLYRWIPTDEIVAKKKVRAIDPDTNKLAIDKNGEPVYKEVVEYRYIREIRDDLVGKVILIDESSMVNSYVWYDLIESGFFDEIYAYGDEKQLPPIEKYAELSDEVRPYYQFWHNLPAGVTLTKCYRHAGDLKMFVDVCEQAIFKPSRSIPTPMYVGDNFSIHNSYLTETDLLTLMVDADIIITPYNKVRNLCNNICRREKAIRAGKKFNPLPVVGDKIIFTDAIKKAADPTAKKPYKQVYLAKNVSAVITAIYDISITDNVMIMDFTDETGTNHKAEPVSLSRILGVTNKRNDYACIDYAYAITAHSSQGSQWPNVLFLDSHFPNDLDKLRYVSITRAEKQLSIVTGITSKTEAADASTNILVRISSTLLAR